MTRAHLLPAAFSHIVADRWTAPFWAAAAEERLVVARCDRCDTVRMPPTPFCPACLCQHIRWAEVGGEGTIFSFTVIHRALVPELADAVPYVPAVVTLDGADGARLIAPVAGCDLNEIHIDRKVAVRWHRADPVQPVPYFVPAS